MHHTTRALRAVRGALLTLVVFGLGTGLARAQDEAPAVVVPVNGTYKLSIEKNITKVFNPKEDVIRVAPVPLYNSFMDVWTFAQVLARQAV